MKDLFDETFQEETAKINPPRLLKKPINIFHVLTRLYRFRGSSKLKVLVLVRSLKPRYIVS